MSYTSQTSVVDGIRTHYLEAGSGKPVVLLHSGEFGSSAELCWSANIGALAERYHVFAPDWLGFGGTDKLYDFVDGRGRRQNHMARFLQELGIGSAAFIGSSMGGSDLVRNVAARSGRFDVAAMVLSSGGGFSPDNAARRLILEYDGSLESMRELVRTLFRNPALGENEEFVAAKHAASLAPGAWESLAAARFRSPATPPREHFGQQDVTPYDDIAVPTLIVAGAEDPLREPGYAHGLHARIPDSEVRVYEGTGHFPHIERAERFNADVLDFLDRRYPA